MNTNKGVYNNSPEGSSHYPASEDFGESNDSPNHMFHQNTSTPEHSISSQYHPSPSLNQPLTPIYSRGSHTPRSGQEHLQLPPLRNDLENSPEISRHQRYSNSPGMDRKHLDYNPEKGFYSPNLLEGDYHFHQQHRRQTSQGSHGFRYSSSRDFERSHYDRDHPADFEAKSPYQYPYSSDNPKPLFDNVNKRHSPAPHNQSLPYRSFPSNSSSTGIKPESIRHRPDYESNLSALGQSTDYRDFPSPVLPSSENIYPAHNQDKSYSRASAASNTIPHKSSPFSHSENYSSSNQYSNPSGNFSPYTYNANNITEHRSSQNFNKSSKNAIFPANTSVSSSPANFKNENYNEPPQSRRSFYFKDELSDIDVIGSPSPENSQFSNNMFANPSPFSTASPSFTGSKNYGSLSSFKSIDYDELEARNNKRCDLPNQNISSTSRRTSADSNVLINPKQSFSPREASTSSYYENDKATRYDRKYNTSQNSKTTPETDKGNVRKVQEAALGLLGMNPNKQSSSKKTPSYSRVSISNLIDSEEPTNYTQSHSGTSYGESASTDLGFQHDPDDLYRQNISQKEPAHYRDGLPLDAKPQREGSVLTKLFKSYDQEPRAKDIDIDARLQHNKMDTLVSKSNKRDISVLNSKHDSKFAALKRSNLISASPTNQDSRSNYSDSSESNSYLGSSKGPRHNNRDLDPYTTNHGDSRVDISKFAQSSKQRLPSHDKSVSKFSIKSIKLQHSKNIYNNMCKRPRANITNGSRPAENSYNNERTRYHHDSRGSSEIPDFATPGHLQKPRSILNRKQHNIYSINEERRKRADIVKDPNYTSNSRNRLIGIKSQAELDQYIFSNLNKNDFYNNLLAIPEQDDLTDISSYKKYLKNRINQAIKLSREEDAKSKRKLFESFTKDHKGRLSDKIIKNKNIFSSKNRSYYIPDLESDSSSDSPLDLDDVYNSLIYNPYLLSSDSNSSSSDLSLEESLADQGILGHFNSKFKNRFSLGSPLGDIRRNMSDRLDAFSHKNTDSAVSPESIHDSEPLIQRTNLTKFSDNDQDENVYNIINRIKKLNYINENSYKQLFPDLYKHRVLISGNGTGSRFYDQLESADIDSSYDSEDIYDFISAPLSYFDSNLLVDSSGSSSDISIPSPKHNLESSVDFSPRNNLQQELEPEYSEYPQYPQTQVVKPRVFSEEDYLKEWRATFRNIVYDAIPKVYKDIVVSISARQSNCRKVAQLCQREAKKASRTMTVRGGPLNTLGDNRAPKEFLLKSRRVTREALLFWKRFERDEREARKKAEKEALEKLKLEEDAREAIRQSRKLNFLITQTELYSHFVGAKIKGELENGSDIKENTSPDSEQDLDDDLGNDENFSDLDFDNASDSAIRERAERNAKLAIARQRAKTREFDSNTSNDLEVSEAVDSMNFQDPTTLGGSSEIPQPRMLMCQLKEYQLKGLHWLASLYEQGINGILADEMGLGKTVQSISLMAHLAEKYDIWGPFIVVAPASTLHNWQQEITRFTPELKVLPYWGTQKDRKILRKSFWNVKHLGRSDSNFHVLVTSYQIIVSDESVLNRVKWQYMILDEAQAIKSSSSARWKTLLQFKSRNRLLLTGTPIQNSMQELWALLHFIMPSLFDSHEEFSEWFSRDIESHAENNTTLNSHQLRRLHMILKPFMLRRIKKHVQHELGEKIEHFVYCNLTYRQAKMYSGLMQKISIADLLSKLQSTNLNNIDADENLMNLVMQFRKVCNHPELFERAEIVSPFAFSNFSMSVLNRPGSQLLYAPTKSVISFTLPKLLLEILPNFKDSSYFDLNSQGYSLTSKFGLFRSLGNLTNSQDAGLDKLLLDSFPFKGSQDSSQVVPQNSEEAVDEYFIVKSKLENFKSLIHFAESEDDVRVYKNFVWKLFGIHFLARDLSQFIEPNQNDIVSCLCSVTHNNFSYNALRLMNPAYKPPVVALTPEIICSDSSFVSTQDFLTLGHPLRHRIQPSALKTAFKKNPAFYNCSSMPSNDLSESFLYKSRTPIWAPSVDKLIRYSGKMSILDPLLTNLKAEGHRVLIYFQMTKMIDLMEEYLTYRQYTYLRLDGSSKISDRRNMVMDWQTRPDIFIFLLSTRAGGLGINLTAADTVIFYDSDWNPTVDQQAMDRAHRLGQTKQVTVYRLITKGTIEERILERARQKDFIHKIVIAGGSTNNTNEQTSNTAPTQNDDSSVSSEQSEKTSEHSNLESQAASPNSPSTNEEIDPAHADKSKSDGKTKKRKKNTSTPGQNTNLDDENSAFTSEIMELRTNDILSMLIDESSGNDDLLWSKRLQQSRETNFNQPDGSLSSQAGANPSGDLIDQNSQIVASLKPQLDNMRDPLKSCNAYSNTRSIVGPADRLFDLYYESLKSKKQVAKKQTNKKTSDASCFKEPAPRKPYKKRATKEPTSNGSPSSETTTFEAKTTQNQENKTRDYSSVATPQDLKIETNAENNSENFPSQESESPNKKIKLTN
ncbi:hypothetical protein BB560_002692 [Smittium megazygosporum]|uniref:Chromatin-remodeling ATPase INO80 n=1 Tax=Smittium megazygosporum TaxID=133381 RepID=A0A2T9ZE05_9FUNG|nr:hypothetical protein BB560_002692 [Smittium megazygosporum]